jgi:hypothetical protein
MPTHSVRLDATYGPLDRSSIRAIANTTIKHKTVGCGSRSVEPVDFGRLDGWSKLLIESLEGRDDSNGAAVTEWQSYFVKSVPR